GPFIEVVGLIIIVMGFLSGLIDLQVFLLLMFVATMFGMMLSVTALLLEEISFHMYQKPKDLLRLFFAAIIENFGYRQMNSVFRIIGFYHWLFNTKRSWGSMKRKGL
ncbi:MAG: glycosyltransferase family 2 protein, partial [Gammaproteobacteria bacterium]|nr:glycosyltransferase family 2 protein [Gammaproteobacteria bacterium]